MNSPKPEIIRESGIGNRESGIGDRESVSLLPIPGSRFPIPDRPLTAARHRKALGEADSILHQFLARLQAIKILDPACGSGNFLYVSLLKLKDLEKEVILFGMEKGLGAYLPAVGPWQLYGIEINPYAFDLAQMTVWIGWLQWIRFNGFGCLLYTSPSPRD